MESVNELCHAERVLKLNGFILKGSNYQLHLLPPIYDIYFVTNLCNNSFEVMFILTG